MSRQTDLAEFTDFVTGCEARMIRLAELLTGDRARAADLARDGFARACAAWGSIRAGEPEAYVRHAIVRGHTEWLPRRPRRARPQPGPAGDPTPAPVPAARDVPAGDPAPATVPAAREVVLRALATLTARERAVLVLRCYAGLSDFQIAYELGVTAGTVRSAAARALGKLRAGARPKAEAAP